ncbi:serine/threonine-protein kinase [Paraliomyxa miuraensis]|uniref:serine/threonine-protein kinase n=1 Tax=Paraliomyxa miuraensis TaxID=376150 RepID=UPI002258FAB7|nr:serine/threonine-protein kinase [Paraliomyxa miuraensis]MCX4241984.1 protein kinase [Paraliomyxa miuraensis]
MSGLAAITTPTWIRSALEGTPLERDLVPLRPGEPIPGSRYRIVRWLGEGGMGVVYEAEHVDMGRRAAVKILRPEVCHRVAVAQAFRDEARAASRIQSEFVVQLYDFNELPDGRLMIAMELLEGRSLHEALSGPMEPARAVGILRQVCRGLCAAHAAGVVHRDIKPENVLLTTKDGRADAVKLVDFGIAAIHDGSESTAIRGGTPHYLAPEVAMGGSVEPSVDVYAWGCLAFELLTGRVPFEGTDVCAVLRAHLSQEPPTPSSCCPDLPVALDAVVLGCLAKDPASRLPSMDEVEAALCEAQLACGLQTPWDDLPPPMVEPERRERLSALLPSPPSRSRRRLAPLAPLAAAVVLLLGGLAVELLPGRSSEATELVASSWVEQQGQRARAAAAKAFFVYPPVEEPRHETAYTVVRALELREGEDQELARTLASELRDELASTLERLGNDYWHEEGGHPFAVSYYEQALLFDPEREMARTRVSATDEQFEALARRAESLAFSYSELLGAEPLVVLAASTTEARREELQALRGRQVRRASALDQMLSQLGGLGPAHEDESGGEEDPPGPLEGNEVTVADATVADATDADHQGSRPPRVSRDDRRRAVALAKDGRAALASGSLQRAELLFQRALGHDRHCLDALVGLREVAFERGAYERAVELGERVVRASPRGAGHHLRLGDAYLKVLRHRDALAHYERARDLGESRAEWRISKVRSVLGDR